MISSDPSPPVTEPRKQRSDGAAARLLLLQAGLKLFAEKGLGKTSTRELALAANANIGSISDYFGNKAGLYRAAFTESMACTGWPSALPAWPFSCLSRATSCRPSGPGCSTLKASTPGATRW